MQHNPYQAPAAQLAGPDVKLPRIYWGVRVANLLALILGCILTVVIIGSFLFSTNVTWSEPRHLSPQTILFAVLALSCVPFYCGYQAVVYHSHITLLWSAGTNLLMLAFMTGMAVWRGIPSEGISTIVYIWVIPCLGNCFIALRSLPAARPSPSS